MVAALTTVHFQSPHLSGKQPQGRVATSIKHCLPQISSASHPCCHAVPVFIISMALDSDHWIAIACAECMSSTLPPPYRSPLLTICRQRADAGTLKTIVQHCDDSSSQGTLVYRSLGRPRPLGQRRYCLLRAKGALLAHDLYDRKVSPAFGVCGMASRTAPMT